MPFWDRPRRVRDSFDAMADQLPVTLGTPVPVATSSGPNSRTVAQAASSTVVTRNLAMRVPTIRRCRNVIAGTLATFDLSLWEAGAKVAPNPNTDDVTATFLRRPDPKRTRAALIADTVDDLFFHDRSFWYITDGRNVGTPGAARWIPAGVERIEQHRVTHTDRVDRDGKRHRDWFIDGKKVPTEQLIVFEGAGVGGILTSGQTVLTALELEFAAWRYARSPLPQVILKNQGIELDQDEQDELVEQYETARETSATAYLNTAVDLERVGWSARELQLVDARQHMALECARLCNVAPHYAMAPSQESMTYSNVQDERRGLVDISLRPYMDVIGQTLSVDAAHKVGYTLCATGREVALDPKSFLQLSDLDRANLWNTLGPGGADVLNRAEIRALEPLAPEGSPNA